LASKDKSKYHWQANRRDIGARMEKPTHPAEAHPPEVVSLREAFRTSTRVALLSFGGPAGQIAVMHRIIVDEKKWIPEDRVLHALNYCMLLPALGEKPGMLGTVETIGANCHGRWTNASRLLDPQVLGNRAL
jgi:hypothetical protein